MFLPDIVQTLSSLLEIALNMEKCWKYFDCTLFKRKECKSLACPGPMPFSLLVGPELAVCSHGETQRGGGENAVCAMSWTPPLLECLQYHSQ